MLTKTYCDQCGELIEIYYLKLDLGGEIYKFCESDCLQEFLEEHIVTEDVEEDEYEE